MQIDNKTESSSTKQVSLLFLQELHVPVGYCLYFLNNLYIDKILSSSDLFAQGLLGYVQMKNLKRYTKAEESVATNALLP